MQILQSLDMVTSFACLHSCIGLHNLEILPNSLSLAYKGPLLPLCLSLASLPPTPHPFASFAPIAEFLKISAYLNFVFLYDYPFITVLPFQIPTSMSTIFTLPTLFNIQDSAWFISQLLTHNTCYT